jgi:glyoxylase-like metal-dependent hydrolase (beta-lactamase superfamily II)
MNIQCITLRAFQVNAYLLEDPASQVCALVDTGFDEQLAETLAQVTPAPNIQAILLTHGHFDHAGGLVPLQQRYPEATTYLPTLEKPLFDSLPRQGELVFGAPQFNRPCGRIDQWVEDGDSIAVGPLRFGFLSTPGHTPGQGCYYTDEAVFVGDTLFAGSVGRTDFPLSDPQLAAVSLSRLLKLPGHLEVHSGHGPITTLQQELHTNPFLEHVRREQGIHTSAAYQFASHNNQY